jgi:4-oxalocrotonate tautomerase
MPHVIVKMLAGRTEEQKARIAEEVSKALITAIDCPETSISIGIEDVARDAWTATVYNPDILEKSATIYKKPGYDPH